MKPHMSWFFTPLYLSPPHDIGINKAKRTDKPPYDIWRKISVTGRVPQEIKPVIAFMK